MAYKDSKTRLELLTKIIERNKNYQTPLGDISKGTIYLLQNCKYSEKEMEKLLKDNPLDFLYIIAEGKVEREVGHELEIFVKRFNRYCRQFGL